MSCFEWLKTLNALIQSQSQLAKVVGDLFVATGGAEEAEIVDNADFATGTLVLRDLASRRVLWSWTNCCGCRRVGRGGDEGRMEVPGADLPESEMPSSILMLIFICHAMNSKRASRTSDDLIGRKSRGHATSDWELMRYEQRRFRRIRSTCRQPRSGWY